MAKVIPTSTDDSPWTTYVVVEDGSELSPHYGTAMQAHAFNEGYEVGREKEKNDA